MKHAKPAATIAGFVLAAAVALACGGGESDVSSGDNGGAPAGAADATSQAPTLEKKVGQTITVANDSTVVKYTIAKTEQKAGNEFMKPSHGVYLLGQLQVNVTKGNAFVCGPCEMSFVGPDGTVYEATTALLEGYKDFVGADIAAGQKADGWVTFDVPKAALKGGKIQLKVTNIFTEDKYAYWTL